MPGGIVVCWIVVLTPGMLTLGVLLYGLFLRAPRVLDGPPRDVLILAAHPDDCVITAGEYAIEAIGMGRRVDVIYLTCGDASAGSPRAAVRRQESINAWGVVGVGSEHLHFLDLPESPVRGPVIQTPEQLTDASRRIERVLAEFDGQATVILPAEGELHVDHVTLRRLAMEALPGASGQHLVLEAPEYNVYFSVLHSPRKAIRYLIDALPVVRRVLTDWPSSVPPYFPQSDGEMMLPADPDRLGRKIEMLRCFTSENSELLVKLFGFPDRYRTVPDLGRNAMADTTQYFRVGERFLSPSLLMLWISLFGTLFLASWTLAVRLTHWTMPSPLATLGIASLGLLAVVMAARRNRRLEDRWLYALTGAGILTGVAKAVALHAVH